MSRCASGKRRYRDEIAAKLALARVREQLDDVGAEKLPIRFYPCRNCRGFHLTSQPLNAPCEPVAADDGQ